VNEHDDNEEHISEAATAAGFGTFVPHYTVEIKMGVPPVIGAESLLLYDYIRANAYFGSPKKASTLLGKLALLRTRDGKLGAWLSYARLAEAFGWSAATVARHLVPLREVGWIRSIEIDRSLRAHAYVIGESVSNSQGTHAWQFYREAMTEALHRAMTRHALDVRDHASIYVLTPQERLAFTREWIERRRAQSRAAA